MQHQQVEAVRAAAFELLGGGHADEFAVFFRPAQLGIGETRIAAAALALAFVEIMTDHADEAVGVAVDALERAAQQVVGLAVAIDIRGDEGADAGLVGGLDATDEALFAEGFSKMHEASAAPGAVCRGCGIHNRVTDD